MHPQPITKKTLLEANPDLAAQLVDPSLAARLAPKSNKKVEWRCNLGHTWSAAPATRTKGHGCPYCSNQKILPGFNDLATANPDLASQLVDSSLATRLAPMSNKKVEWRCNLGHTWAASLTHRSRGRGCPYCTNRQAWPGFNDLATLQPILAEQLVDTGLAHQLTYGTHKKVAWRCSKDHVWSAAVADRSKGKGCPYCSNQKILPGFNDLATLQPILAEQLVDQTLATKLTVSSGTKVTWRCKRNHTWQAAPATRTKGHGCPYCAGQTVWPGFNDLATTNPDLAAQLVDPEMATKLAAGSNKVVNWCCGAGHIWPASPSTRARSGCSACAQYGFSSVAPTRLYLLHQQELGLLKVGVSNTGCTYDRNRKFIKEGWALLENIMYDAGADGYAAEQDLLKRLRAHEPKDQHTLELKQLVAPYLTRFKTYDGVTEMFVVSPKAVEVLSDVFSTATGLLRAAESTTVS